MSNFGDGWTDQRIANLKRLWADGLSASQIAAEIGGVTRNAVIGKVSRLGLSGRRQAAPRRASVFKPQRTTPLRPATPRAPKAAPEPMAEVILLEIPVAQRKTLLQLNERNCRWPAGDPRDADFYFCGGDVAGEHVYCAYHCRVAYETPEMRRARVLAERREKERKEREIA